MNNGKLSANSARAQRKFLRGAITDAGFRGGELADSLPPDAFVGARAIAYVAESSWFMYCYTCALEDSCGHGQFPRADR